MRRLIYHHLGYSTKSNEGLRTGNILRFPCITNLGEAVRVPLGVIVVTKFRYLIFECQEVVVDKENSQGNHIVLDFQRSAITGDWVVAEYHVYLEAGADLMKHFVQHNWRDWRDMD